MTLSSTWTQFVPPKNGAPLTEANLSPQKGKVFIITGGSSGIGFSLAKILYDAGGIVYILTRNKSSAEQAIEEIETASSDREVQQKGELKFIHMDLRDLASVRNAAETFNGSAPRLDILFNNAGIGVTNDKHTQQGIQCHLQVNCIAHLLLAKLLLPKLAATAAQLPPSSVRIVWPTSVMIDMLAPKGGLEMEHLETPPADDAKTYLYSKTATWFVAAEFARRHGSKHGVVSIAGNPGNFASNLYREASFLQYWMARPILRNTIYGAYTYLWLGFSDDVNLDEALQGRLGICDGRWHPAPRKDLLDALKGKDIGGTGRAQDVFDWCESKLQPFLDS